MNNIRVLLLLLILISNGFSTGPLRREYRDFRVYPRMDRAYKRIAAKEYGEAEKLLLDVIRIDPSRQDAYETLINLYVKTGEYSKVEPYITKVSPKSSASQNYYYSITPKMPGAEITVKAPPAFSIEAGYLKLKHSYLLIDRGYYKKAEATLLDLNHNYPQYDQPDEALIVLYLEMEDTAKAIYYLSQLSDNNRMREYYEPQLKKYQDKSNSLMGPVVSKPERAVKSSEQIHYEQMSRVYLLIEEKKYSEAEKTLLKMYSRTPENQQICEALLVINSEQGRMDEAEKYAKQLPRSSKTRNQFYHNAAAQEVQRGNFDQAYLYMDSLDRSNAKVHQSELAYVARAQAYDHQNNGDFESAEQAFRQALVYDESDSEARRALIMLLAGRKEYNEAKQAAKELSLSDPIHVSLAVDFAAELRQNNQSDSALTVLSAVNDEITKTEGFYAEKGYNQRNLDMADSAVISFEKAREINSENYGYTREIAQSKQLAGDKDGASSAYIRAIDEVPLFAQNRNLTESEKKIDLFRLQRTNHYLQKVWDFNLTTLWRLDDFETPTTAVSPLEYASYSGFLNLEVSFSPTFFKRHFSLFVSSLTSIAEQTLRPEEGLGVGIKVVPALKVPVVLVFQHSFGFGDYSRDFWMGRIAGSFSRGVDWEPVKTPRLFTNNYAEAAYLLGENAIYLTYNGEVGLQFTLDSERMAGSMTPYGTLGLTLNTDNADKEAVYRFDGGLGVAFSAWGAHNSYRSYRMKNRVSFEWRAAFITNSNDWGTLRLRWELNL